MSRPRRRRVPVACAVWAASVLQASAALADVPQQIIPSIAEQGAPQFSVQMGAALGDSDVSITGSTSPYTATPPSNGGDAMANLMATSFGASAVTAATQAGINPNALAAIGQVESQFQNVNTANGSSSATGPWQITSGTWNEYENTDGLSNDSADRTDPAAQAAVASNIIGSYADTVSEQTGKPATVVQAYGAYVFGPTAGGSMAKADPSEPLSSIISSTALSNNGMQNWTVGQFYTTMSGRLGSSASETVRST